jgi:hypothetical protein
VAVEERVLAHLLRLRAAVEAEAARLVEMQVKEQNHQAQRLQRKL